MGGGGGGGEGGGEGRTASLALRRSKGTAGGGGKVSCFEFDEVGDGKGDEQSARARSGTAKREMRAENLIFERTQLAEDGLRGEGVEKELQSYEAVVRPQPNLHARSYTLSNMLVRIA